MQVSAKCASLVLLGLLASAAGALPPPWVPLGPFGGDIRTLTSDPARSGTLYATTGHGTFKTTDGGVSWAASSLERPASNVAVDPVHPSTLYLGVEDQDLLLKSTDGGAHWAPSADGLTPNTRRLFPALVAVDPSNPRRLVLFYDLKLWRSTDAGASWQLAASPPPAGSSPFGLVFAARPAGTAFFASSSGLYRSTDAGSSWRLAPGLPADLVPAVTVAPSDPRTVYAFLERNGLYRSADGGSSWRRVTSRADIFGQIAVSLRSPRTLYASTFGGPLFHSTDGGATWAPPSGLDGVTSVAFDPGARSRLYAGTLARPLGGVWRSDDAGATWARRSQGLTGLAAPLLATAPADPGRLWTMAGPALFRSANGGVRWARVNAPGSSFLLGLEAGSASDLFAAVPSQIPRGPTVYSVWKSPDGGLSWRMVLDPVSLDVRRIRVAPSAPATVYAGGFSLVERTGRIYRSTDGGETWELRSSGDPSRFCGFTDLAVAPSAAGVLYFSGFHFNEAAARCEGVVLRSDDGGATWRLANAGLPQPAVLSLAVDPHDPNQVYAGTSGSGIWKSTDGGASWSRAGSELGGLSLFTLLASEVPGRVYAVAADRVFRSDDGGASWHGWSRGLRATGLSGLAADAADPRRIYAATQNGIWALTETD